MRIYDEWQQTEGQTEFRPIAPEELPQDPDGRGAGWIFRVLQLGGREHDAMPQWIEAKDAHGRCAIYKALEPDDPAKRPQDSGGDGSGWTFKTLNPDAGNVPHAILGTDPHGRNAIYEPLRLEGKIGRWMPVGP